MRLKKGCVVCMLDSGNFSNEDRPTDLPDHFKLLTQQFETSCQHSKQWLICRYD